MPACMYARPNIIGRRAWKWSRGLTAKKKGRHMTLSGCRAIKWTNQKVNCGSVLRAEQRRGMTTDLFVSSYANDLTWVWTQGFRVILELIPDHRLWFRKCREALDLCNTRAHRMIFVCIYEGKQHPKALFCLQTLHNTSSYRNSRIGRLPMTPKTTFFTISKTTYMNVRQAHIRSLFSTRAKHCDTCLWQLGNNSV